MKKINFTKNGFKIKKAISCLASMAVLLAQLPEMSLEVKAEEQTFGGITFSVSGSEYTVVSCDQSIENGEKYVGVKYELIAGQNENEDTWTVTYQSSGLRDVIILASINDKLVTSIVGSAFQSNRDVTSIFIPDSVTSIGGYAFFGCSALESINIPENVVSIGSYAFSGCSSLVSINIPSSLTIINDHTFQGCYNLESVNISAGITSIGEAAFISCWALTSIIIPNGVESIGICAFEECSELVEITIPNSVTTIGSSVFNRCNKLNSITIPCNKVALLSGTKVTVTQNGTEFTNPDGKPGDLILTHEYNWAQPENIGGNVVYTYGCANCDESVPGYITIEGVTDELEMAKNSQAILVAAKVPENSMTLTWTSANEKATLTAQGESDDRYILGTGNTTGEVEITVAGVEENSPEKTFTLKIKNYAGVITNNSYPQFYYLGQAVKDPEDFFSKNAENPSTLYFEWYAGPKAEGTALVNTPSEVGVYTLKGILPASTDYTRAECILPVRIAVLPVKVADRSGELSMQAQQLRVTEWEKADSKNAETFVKIGGSENRATYTPSEDDYEKYVRVVTEDDSENEVISEPVLVKFLKNSISFK